MGTRQKHGLSALQRQLDVTLINIFDMKTAASMCRCLAKTTTEKFVSMLMYSDTKCITLTPINWTGLESRTLK